MKTHSTPQNEISASVVSSTRNSHSFSFSSFLNAIKENSEIRRKTRDLVDLGLFEYAFERNSAFITKVLELTEAENMRLMMHFTKGVGDLQKIKNRIRRNRIIRTLAQLDCHDQSELIKRLTSANS